MKSLKGNDRLERLAKAGQLKDEPPSRDEIDGLLRSAKPRLRDSMNETLSLESRFDLAYNAAHAISLAALRLYGYRSENRYLVFQCLSETVKLEPAQWRILDTAHRKRNNAEYSGVVDIDEAIVKAVIEISHIVLQCVSDLIDQ